MKGSAELERPRALERFHLADDARPDDFVELSAVYSGSLNGLIRDDSSGSLDLAEPDRLDHDFPLLTASMR